MNTPRRLARLMVILFAATITTEVQGGVTRIDALLSTGYYINIEDTSPIQLQSDNTSADPFHTFRGCMETVVDSNFDAQLLVSARATSSAGGRWEADIHPFVVPVGQVQIRLCIVGYDVHIEQLVGGRANLKVAEIVVEVIPR